MKDLANMTKEELEQSRTECLLEQERVWCELGIEGRRRVLADLQIVDYPEGGIKVEEIASQDNINLLEDNLHFILSFHYRDGTFSTANLVKETEELRELGRQLDTSEPSIGTTPTCPSCGHDTVANGTYRKCLNCNESVD